MGVVENLDVSVGQKVLLLWSGNQDVKKLQQLVEALTKIVGETGKVQVENIERLTLCELMILRYLTVHIINLNFTTVIYCHYIQITY